MLHFNSLRKLTGGLLALSLFVASVPARAADYAPIDCAKASSPAERTICRSYSLGQADARMATLFGVVTSLVAMGQRADIGDAQRTWLRHIDPLSRPCRVISMRLHRMAHFDDTSRMTLTLSAEPIPAY